MIRKEEEIEQDKLGVKEQTTGVQEWNLVIIQNIKEIIIIK